MTALAVGFYGKLPSHGDFLRRRVSDAFVHAWDGWLQECFAASRATLGERWLEVYLTSPSWRFACEAGVLGSAPVVGLMVPSVDRVGRYFHLTLVASLPEGASVATAATAADTFFERAERLVVDTLAADIVDFEAFDVRVAQLTHDLARVDAPPAVRLDATAAGVLGDGGDVGWQIPLDASAQLRPVFEQLLAQRLADLYRPLAIWWTEGSSIVDPSCLIGRGLPRPEAFAALLDGGWARSHWRPLPAEVQSAPGENPEPLVDDPTPPRFRSAAVTDVGCVRAINQDACLERPDVGVWVVADGLGGHRDGEVASRMVCDALADFVPDASFEQVIADATRRVQEVNAHLIRSAARSADAAGSGSTVVALLTRGTRCAIFWAGDSRVYRLRNGRLEQLTRDHSVAEAEGLAAAEAGTAITRAVGGEDTLTLDVYRDRVVAGDRFLLCSDGLTRTVPDAGLQEWMAHEPIRAGVDGLLAAARAAGAPDNVTIVIVEAFL